VPKADILIGSDHGRIGPQLEEGCEYRIEVALGASIQDMNNAISLNAAQKI
jgi:hypothetical protein